MEFNKRKHLKWIIVICMLITISIAILFVHNSYGLENLYYTLQLKRVNYLIARDTTNVLLYHDRLQLASKLQKYDYLDNDINKFIELGGRDGGVFVAKGLEYLYSNPKLSIYYYTLAINNNAPVYAMRGMAYERARIYDSAIIDYRSENIKDHTYDSDISIRYCYELLGDYDKSSEYYIKRNEWFNVAINYCLIGKYRDALRLLNIDSTYSTNYNFHYYRGMANYKLGNLTKAQKDLETQINLDSSNYLAPYLLSKIFADLGNKNKSIFYLHKSLSMGFPFVDLIDSDESFTKLAHLIDNDVLLSTYKNRNANILDKLSAILKNERANKNDDQFISDRMVALEIYSDKRQEYIKLNRIRNEINYSQAP